MHETARHRASALRADNRAVTDQELDHRLAWLRLTLTPGVGRGTARELLAQFGPPDALFVQPASTLQATLGATLAAALRTVPDGFEAARAQLSAWLAGDGQRELITLDDARFPTTLLHTADPPLMLYAQGDVSLLQRPAVAVVGSRNPTAQGSDNAKAFARALADRGYTIVSGLALGIDGAAHEAALQSTTMPLASTIAVVGTGLDRIYPARHATLARAIAAKGLILSEFPLGTPPLRENFPQRNRIIAGLSEGTLVVEAALQSGSLITAQLAMECGREVFAIPGSIHSPQSHGCHALIKQGAKLVETADDVLSELARAGANQSITTPPAAPLASMASTALEEQLPAAWRSLLQAMAYDPCTLDAVLARTGLDAGEAQAQLLDLELDGWIQRLPGGRFQRRASA